MTQVVASLSEISARYDVVFCDLWGCLHNGKTPFPDAVAALQAFRSQGGRVILLTNAPRPNMIIIKQLDGMGVPRDAWDAVVSAGDSAQYAMLSGAVGRQVFHIGAPKDESFFTDFSDELADLAAQSEPITRVAIKDATGIVCTGLADDLTETPEDYRAVLLMGKTLGLPMLCANPDIIVDMGETRLYCAGALAEAYEAMGGTALYFGKPHPAIYDLARRRLAGMGLKEDAAILCIGDGIGTDVQGAMSENLDALFISGGIAAAEFGADSANPDKALLESWLEAKMLSPAFSMGHLR